MGVLENSLTLENGAKIHVEELNDYDKLLSWY